MAKEVLTNQADRMTRPADGGQPTSVVAQVLTHGLVDGIAMMEEMEG